MPLVWLVWLLVLLVLLSLVPLLLLVVVVLVVLLLLGELRIVTQRTAALQAKKGQSSAKNCDKGSWMGG